MFECKVYRDSWLRGEPQRGLLWRHTDNQMCCLGQVGFQAGVPIGDMRGIGDFAELYGGADKLLEVPALNGLIQAETQTYYGDDGFEENAYVDATNTDIADRAMQVNDSAEINATEREQRITEILAEANVAVTFVDGVAPWFQTPQAVAA